MLCTVDANVCAYVKCTIVADVYVVYNYREHVRSWALNKANVYCIQGVHMYIVYHVCGCVYNGMCVCVCVEYKCRACKCGPPSCGKYIPQGGQKTRRRSIPDRFLMRVSDR